MGVTIRKKGTKWFVFVNHLGRRKAKCVGSKAAAEQVKRVLEAKLTLGDLGMFADQQNQVPLFGDYADRWLRDYARVECKTSTADGYEGVLRQYLRPRFGVKRLDEIKRDDIKTLITELIGKKLSRNTIRNALCVIRGLFNQAIESGILDSNPASRLGRFTRTAKTAESRGVSLTTTEVLQFLEAAKEVCPTYYPIVPYSASRRPPPGRACCSPVW